MTVQLALLIVSVISGSSAGMIRLTYKVFLTKTKLIIKISESPSCNTGSLYGGVYGMGMCTFPVVHAGKTYYQCLTDQDDISWCPPQVTDEHERKFWRECNSDFNKTSDVWGRSQMTSAKFS